MDSKLPRTQFVLQELSCLECAIGFCQADALGSWAQLWAPCREESGWLGYQHPTMVGMTQATSGQWTDQGKLRLSDHTSCGFRTDCAVSEKSYMTSKGRVTEIAARVAKSCPHSPPEPHCPLSPLVQQVLRGSRFWPCFSWSPAVLGTECAYSRCSAGALGQVVSGSAEQESWFQVPLCPLADCRPGQVPSKLPPGRRAS